MAWTRMLVGQSPVRTLIRGLTLAAVLLVLSKTVVVPVRAGGVSMLPTYHDGQLLFFNALAYRWSNPVRGDIAAITVVEGEVVLVKRVVGLPGERIRILDGTLLVNDAPVAEPYAVNRARWNVEEVELAADEFYVIGDNRQMAQRNHTFGVVSRGSLFGRLIL